MANTRRKPKAPANKDDVIVPQDDATRHFVQTLVANGQAHVITERETVEDVIGRYRVPSHLLDAVSTPA